MKASRPPLSRRQRDVLVRLAAGDTLDQAAEALELARGTVAKYLYETQMSLHARNRTHAVVLGLQSGELILEQDSVSAAPVEVDG